MNQRRTVTPQFKTRVVREVLTPLNRMAHVGRDSALQAQVSTRSKAAWCAHAWSGD